MIAEHQRRLEAIASIERLLQRREQQVAVREEVLAEALRAGGRHLPISHWESEIDRMVTEAAARLPPPIALSAFAHELEDRAIELEGMHLALERKEESLEAGRREVARLQAQLVHKEEYLTNWMQTMEVALQKMSAQEDALASQARRREEGEAELLIWTQQLRSKEDALQNRERLVSLKVKEATSREQRAHELEEKASKPPRNVASELQGPLAYPAEHSYLQGRRSSTVSLTTNDSRPAFKIPATTVRTIPSTLDHRSYEPSSYFDDMDTIDRN